MADDRLIFLKFFLSVCLHQFLFLKKERVVHDGQPLKRVACRELCVVQVQLKEAVQSFVILVCTRGLLFVFMGEGKTRMLWRWR